MSDERAGTEEILRDARYHKAALAADPRTTHLADRLRKPYTQLKVTRAAADEKEEARVEGLARLLRSDFELDERLRLLELDVLRDTKKNRSDPRYKAIFPRGLSGLLAMRGEEQSREVEALTKQLRARKIPNAALACAELADLADVTAKADAAWRQAETDAAQAFGEEVLARFELIRQLQKSEGALLAEFPGQRRRVRSFFRPTRRRGAAPDDGRPETALEPASGERPSEPVTRSFKLEPS